MTILTDIAHGLEESMAMSDGIAIYRPPAGESTPVAEIVAGKTTNRSPGEHADRGFDPSHAALLSE